MQPCIASIWKADAAEPSPDRLTLDRELALDRDLFEVRNMSVSRSTNAPKLTSLSSRRVRLVIPAQCATGAVVIARVDFDALQRRVASGQSGASRVRVAELGWHSLVARGAHSAAGLLRASSPDPERPDQLVALPQILKLEGPIDVELMAPSVVIVGPGAVAIHPGITVFPESGQNILDQSQRFRLPALNAESRVAAGVESTPSASASTLIRVAGNVAPCLASDLPRVAQAVLSGLGRKTWFVPVLVNDRDPRLCLLYQRADGRYSGLVSTADLDGWLGQVHQYCPEERRTPRSAPTTRSSGTYKVITSSPPPRSNASSSLQSPPIASTPPLASPARLGKLETTHAGFGKALDRLARARHTHFSILVLGESGTGKEHLARELHAQSSRAQGPFVSVNVSALPESLVESELFGHTKGAFTGTHAARGGAFVIADGGTLLLDEIADAPLKVQVALLSVLETRCVRALGSDRERKVDVRVMAATSRDLSQLMAEGRFREDLYHRLVDLSVTVPPLRERPEDVPAIARTLLLEIDKRLTVSDAALAVLRTQPWPGNIRTLRSTLRRAALLLDGADVIDVAHLSDLALEGPIAAAALPIEFSPEVRETGEELWRQHALPQLWTSRYERRAAHRAALIYLAVERGKDAFPAALKSQWEQLFGQRWSSSENHRGLRDLLRRLGTSLRDSAVCGWVLAIAGT